MSIAQFISSKSGISISYEILPPERGNPINELYKFLDPLIEFKPAFISIANHQSEEKYMIDSDGRFIKCKPDKRPGWLSFSYALKKRYGVEVLPHILCNELVPDQIEHLLIGMNYMGIQNVMALRGDRSASSAVDIKPMGKYKYAYQIVNQIAKLNNGLYLDESLKGFPTNFCIAVAAYPEMHPETIDINTDIRHLKNKVECGAHFVITQMFYDNRIYKDFVERCRSIGMSIPILPGLYPISKKESINLFRSKFKVSIPTELKLALEMSNNADNQAVNGKNWLLNQCKDLLAYDSRHLHFFVFSSKTAEIVYDVLKEIL